MVTLTFAARAHLDSGVHHLPLGASLCRSHFSVATVRVNYVQYVQRIMMLTYTYIGIKQPGSSEVILYIINIFSFALTTCVLPVFLRAITAGQVPPAYNSDSERLRGK